MPKPILPAHRAAARAVFLDRDGVLTRSLGLLGFLLLVVTNRRRDVDAGHNAGCATVLIDRGLGEAMRE